jgi:auxin efflux carrier family protein
MCAKKFFFFLMINKYCSAHNTVPRKAPLLPAASVSTYARFGFNVLTIPLIFSTIASSVTIDSMGDYWFVLAGAVGVLSISFGTATLLGRILPISNASDFNALRIAATFPNIVALPILIFPSLCEYQVVYEAFGEGDDRAEQYQQCVAKSNTMIFCYFFGWSFLFWSFGHPALMSAAKKKSQLHTNKDEQSTTTLGTTNHGHEKQSTAFPIDVAQNQDTSPQQGRDSNKADDESASDENGVLEHIKRAVLQVFASPPFIAMVVAFAVGCISPIRDLFFSPGGALRFIGAAAESLGQASSPMSTIVVAASLACPQTHAHDETEPAVEKPRNEDIEDAELCNQVKDADASSEEPNPDRVEEESPVMSDPNFGPLQLRRRSSIHRFGASLQRGSMRALQKVKRTAPEERRLHLWFSLSRLVLSPALVVLAIVGLDCSGVLGSVPDLAKLVLIVNAAVPGALIVVVLLKSNPDLHETASVVAKVYLPSYILSIFTIAAWTAVGLIVSIPDEDGQSFCARF